jgi:hypothetical protein
MNDWVRRAVLSWLTLPGQEIRTILPPGELGPLVDAALIQLDPATANEVRNGHSLLWRALLAAEKWQVAAAAIQRAGGVFIDNDFAVQQNLDRTAPPQSELLPPMPANLSTFRNWYDRGLGTPEAQQGYWRNAILHAPAAVVVLARALPELVDAEFIDHNGGLERPLTFALHHVDLARESVEHLVHCGAQLDYTVPFFGPDEEKYTPIMIYVKQNELLPQGMWHPQWYRTLDKLCKAAGSNVVNYRTQSGFSALEFAIEQRVTPLVWALIMNGADVDQPLSEGRNALLQFAVYSYLRKRRGETNPFTDEDAKIVELLRDAGSADAQRARREAVASVRFQRGVLTGNARAFLSTLDVSGTRMFLPTRGPRPSELLPAP